MISFTDIAVVLGMMFLRIGVPALVIVALGYGLKRLDQRWEAEAREHQAEMAGKQPEVQPEAPAPQPTAPVRRPAKQPAPQQLPFIPPPAAPRETQVGVYAQTGLPAQKGISAPSRSNWETKSCSSAVTSAYAASGQPDQTCWQARLKVEGNIPEECVSCDVFQRYPTM